MSASRTLLRKTNAIVYAVAVVIVRLLEIELEAKQAFKIFVLRTAARTRPRPQASENAARIVAEIAFDEKQL